MGLGTGDGGGGGGASSSTYMDAPPTHTFLCTFQGEQRVDWFAEVNVKASMGTFLHPLLVAVGVDVEWNGLPVIHCCGGGRDRGRLHCSRGAH